MIVSDDCKGRLHSWSINDTSRVFRMMIVGASRVVKTMIVGDATTWSIILTTLVNVIIYDCNVFIIQAT
jgi:uncharacterized protein (DUF983 family)